MEGIQHRHDCPNKANSTIDLDYVIDHGDGTGVYAARCKDCGRAAMIHGPVTTIYQQLPPEGEK